MTGIPLAAVELYLAGRGLRDGYPDVTVVRGTGDGADLKTGPGRLLVLTRGSGAGLILEQAFDVVTLAVRCVGLQRDYDDAETFAGYVDRLMLAHSNVDVGGHRALYVTRAGGPPTHMTTDKARRAHFSCSYVLPVASGL